MTPHAFDFNFVAEENELSVSENFGRPHAHAGGAQNIYHIVPGGTDRSKGGNSKKC